MTAQACLRELRRIKSAAFATVDDAGQPQVRIIDIMLVRDERLYFCTARGKAFYRQLLRTGRVSVVAMNDAFQMFRLSGSVKTPDSPRAWIDLIFQENPAMEAVYPEDSRAILEPFCLEDGEIEFFDLGRSPIHRESLAFGKARPRDAGFSITEACIGCGQCLHACPQQCIDAGTPCRIRRENCLHCGLCAEVCPVGAVQRKDE